MPAFDQILERIAADPADDSLDAVIAAARERDLDDGQIAALAETLAKSGDVLTFADSAKTADIASTGGPASLTTLLCPLFLRCFGALVPKLGVPGRPAGAVDVLSLISGYRVVLTTQELLNAIDTCGYAHCVASDRHAPLDAALFKRRQHLGASAIPALAIASLLSKKLAMSVRAVGLDVRVAPHGNFGAAWEVARRNAEQFIRVANRLGIKAKCFLSDGTRPSQPFIGRSEALLALDNVFVGSTDDWLNEHASRCFFMSRALLDSAGLSRPTPSALKQQFLDNLASQGASTGAFESHLRRIKAVDRRPLKAPADGFFAVDLTVLRDAIVNANRALTESSGPAVHYADVTGVILRKRPGSLVSAGDVIVEVRDESASSSDNLNALARAFSVMPKGSECVGFEEL